MPSSSVQFTSPIESIPSLGDGVLFVFYAVTAIYVIFTAILYYHWQQYGTNAKVNRITGVVYFTTTLPLLLLMSLLAFTM